MGHIFKIDERNRLLAAGGCNGSCADWLHCLRDTAAETTPGVGCITPGPLSCRNR